MNLVIVESPTKTKTLKKFLGRGWEVDASKGHVKDLPRRKLGVKVENDFAPEYVIIKGKKKIIQSLKKLAEKASKVYLAPDPDREGEAIAWHISQEIGKVNPEVYRASFNEITKQAVLDGIKDAGRIDMNRVQAQQARRIMDRLVGYKVSPLLWKTIYRGLSAGRVQSVALRIICEREQEIKGFAPQEYWTIKALLETPKKETFSAKLFKVDQKEIEIKSQEEASDLVEDIRGKRFKVTEIRTQRRKKSPYPPYITSTLQQDAARRLYFPSRKTMLVAQQLYEGVELGEKGSVGLITYIRTDSVRVSDTAIDKAKGFIQETYGKDYLPPRSRKFKPPKAAQEAHEAIRPTSLEYAPDKIERYLTKDQFRVYKLIWSRFLASQMSDALYDLTSVDIQAERYLFRASSSVLIFDGFQKIYKEVKENGPEEEKDSLPQLQEGDGLDLLELNPEQHFTKPPPRFTEASLIKELESKGIGRPSTYAQIVYTIKERKYVSTERRKIFPTDLGETVNKILVEQFPQIFNVNFTADMEAELDKIAEGECNWVKVLKDFYIPFSATLEKVEKEKSEIRKQLEEKTDVMCDKCGSPMVIKWSRNGKFLACSAYPDCKNTKPLNSKEDEALVQGEKCENCGAPMVLKTGKFGKFLACSRFPECKNTRSFSLKIKCPKEGCEGEIVEKKTKKGRVFYGCSKYPQCDFATWYKPVTERCPECGSEFLVLKKTKSKGETLQCLKCKYEKTVETPSPELNKEDAKD
ncbi:MAG: type I DNA topoisomerase [Candidatus Zixiibacteriota bacterium]